MDTVRLPEVEVFSKSVLVRGDLDVDDADNPRANSIREIVHYLQEKGAARIKVIGHSETGFDLASRLRIEFPNVEFDAGLRQNPGEKENSLEFAQRLSEGFEVYVNEAFATSHRRHASIVSLPKVVRKKGGEVCIGLRFAKELEMLSQVWDKPGRRILVIGGAKIEDKQRFIEKMQDKFDAVLKGGLLPGVDLRSDGLDISDETIRKYCEEISQADVILAAGVMGKYEDEGSSKGTRMVLEAIAANEKAYKVAGGGDIEMAISKYGLSQKFDWISVGGGAMLEYLATGTLPGIEALVNASK